MSQRRQAEQSVPVRRVALQEARPSQALNSYLAEMLADATALDDTDTTVTDLLESEPVISPDPEPEPEAAEDPAAAPAPPPEPEAKAAPEPAPVEQPAESPQAPSESADTVNEGVLQDSQLTNSEQVLAWQDNGRPAWAANRFDCLLFKVDGLSLAVPMVLLGTIYPMDRELTSLFGQPDWFMGLLPVSDSRNIRVIETSRLVMPERYNPESSDSLKYAVGIHGCDWAMACHEVVGSISLSPDEVKWRSERTRRPWLAGTVVDHMCALIDLEAFEQVLLRDRKAQRQTRDAPGVQRKNR